MPGTTMAGHGWPSNIHGWPWLVTEQETSMVGHAWPVLSIFGHEPLASRPLLPKCVAVFLHIAEQQEWQTFWTSSAQVQTSSTIGQGTSDVLPMLINARLYLSRCSKQAGAHKLFVMLSCALSCPKLERRWYVSQNTERLSADTSLNTTYKFADGVTSLLRTSSRKWCTVSSAQFHAEKKLN